MVGVGVAIMVPGQVERNNNSREGSESRHVDLRQGASDALRANLRRHVNL